MEWGNVFSNLIYAKIKPWLYAGAVFVTLGLFAGTWFHGRSKGIASQRPKIERLTAELSDAHASNSMLGKAIQEQNTALEALAAKEKQTREAVADIKKAQSGKKAPKVIEELRLAPTGEFACPVSPLNERGWKELQ